MAWKLCWLSHIRSHDNLGESETDERGWGSDTRSRRAFAAVAVTCMWLRIASLSGCSYKTVQMSVSRHPPTHPPTYPATILHLQSDLGLSQQPEKLDFLVESSSCFWHLSFRHSANTSTLTAHSSAWASSEYSHSFIAVGNNLLSGWHLPATPTHRQPGSRQGTPNASDQRL